MNSVPIPFTPAYGSTHKHTRTNNRQYCVRTNTHKSHCYYLLVHQVEVGLEISQTVRLADGDLGHGVAANERSKTRQRLLTAASDTN